jgi:outer membrane biosynthesis protein TonB
MVPPTPQPADDLIASDTRRIFVDAVPIPPLKLPAYPPDALAAHAGWVLLGVRITIDEHGSVSDIRSSPVTISSPTPYGTLFWKAVEAAATKWRFFPAEYREERRRIVDGKIFWDVIQVEKTASTSDISFNFTAVGDVSADHGR